MSEPVTVRILDREYTVGVSEEERAGLAAAARMLDARMRELRGGNKLVAPDRLAVLTALNLAHELQSAKTGPEPGPDPALALIDEANRKLDALLAQAG
ncbi:MAG: cell division protein ZapA [Proteobacteria bacterium]|nr:cell division protein ZapA [Pseudomonadota bacterium]